MSMLSLDYFSFRTSCCIHSSIAPFVASCWFRCYFISMYTSSCTLILLIRWISFWTWSDNLLFCFDEVVFAYIIHSYSVYFSSSSFCCKCFSYHIIILDDMFVLSRAAFKFEVILFTCSVVSQLIHDHCWVYLLFHIISIRYLLLLLVSLRKIYQFYLLSNLLDLYWFIAFKFVLSEFVTNYRICNLRPNC